MRASGASRIQGFPIGQALRASRKRSWANPILVTILASLLIVSSHAPVTAGEKGAPGCDRSRVIKYGKWTSIRIPELTQGDEIVAYAVDPANPARMYASNGRDVARSLDGGCSWSVMLSIPDTPTAQFPFTACVGNAAKVCARVISITVAPGKPFVYLVVDVGYQDAPANGLVPVAWPLLSRVLVTENDGSDWRFADNGLPAGTSMTSAGGALTARPMFFVAPSDPKTVYTYPYNAGGFGRGLYVTRDAGLTWTLASADPVSGITADLVVHPEDPKRLWRISNRTIAFESSADGGETWQEIQIPNFRGDAQSALDVRHAGGQSSFVLSGWHEGGTTAAIFLSHDSGKSWKVIPSPDLAAWVARGPSLESVAVLTKGGGLNGGEPAGVYRLDGRTGDWINLSPLSQSGIGRLSADSSQKPSYFLHTLHTIEKYKI